MARTSADRGSLLLDPPELDARSPGGLPVPLGVADELRPIRIGVEERQDVQEGLGVGFVPLDGVATDDGVDVGVEPVDRECLAAGALRVQRADADGARPG